MPGCQAPDALSAMTNSTGLPTVVTPCYRLDGDMPDADECGQFCLSG